MTEKQDVILDHDYDGIQEYDNRLPNWWLAILYGTVVFSLAYWLFMHTFGIGNLQVEKYEHEMKAATEMLLAQSAGEEVTDESLRLMAELPETVSLGAELYSQYCAVCHSTKGEGLVGPNLTDKYWIHGGKPTDIHRVISEGVLSKGMAAWGSQLGPTRVEALSAFLLSIQNMEIPGKAAEGELMK
ncbi:MAG: cbb3-type cytochrome c oxidase N-terminal domain-containing protein [Candidatus Krumholzibacteria bacterium]|jgi:cytochrome c oxidase cbb3-type subunit 3|nr:cbb3-type cytochrome c oxidase N-terminal domain-containing protein [Candidatus Krumholzibacteria bacterium]MDP6668620.1 cbb3-type cytochrome c oxidase N-terminal domain-containing protein [Candidatus Krumholzibacteria bacterium]MDP6797712.1 cbb3-type cytochrome c oxidase N-terminal domain-containing protein [Candidatus Krumholzibacteria bacterium]MDP7022310.1 cbb3-type cytochrome c oxidase N-terminal domain-containing protein [Candidatus Krumholzibacteria bacterium]